VALISPSADSTDSPLKVLRATLLGRGDELGDTIVSGAVSAFGVQVATYVIAFIASVVISRAVGPGGRGQYYIAVTAALTAGIVLDLSMVRVLTYFYAERGYDLAELSGATSAITLLASPIALVGMFAAFALLRHSVFAGISLGDYTIAAISVPFQMSLNWMVGLFVLGRRITLSRVAMLAGAVVQTGGAVVLFVMHRLDVRAVLILFVAAAVIPWILCVWWAHGFSSMRPRFNRRLMRSVLAFAGRLHPGFIFWFFMLRFDTFLVKAYLGSRAVGRYSLAILFAEFVWVMAEPLAWAVLPFQTEATAADAGALTFKAMRFSMAIALALAAAEAAVLWLVIPVVYGPGFSGAYPAFLALAPGVVALATVGPVQNVLVRQGRPVRMGAFNVAAFALNVGLNLVFLKRLGIVGAGAASTIAYVAVAGAFIVWAARSTDWSLRNAFWPQPGDRDTVRRLLARIDPRRTPAAVGADSEREPDG
jgi:O-antigen/teichoic acid export membrane protein